MPRFTLDLVQLAAFLALMAFIFVRRPSLRLAAALMLIGALAKLGDVFVDAPLDMLVPRATRELIAFVWFFVTVIGLSTIGTLQARRRLVR